MRVVADAGPLHYLLLIGEIDVLPALFGAIAVPDVVVAELRHTKAPSDVREWMLQPSKWLTIVSASPVQLDTTKLHEGERAAIALAQSIEADLLLIDDRNAASAARSLGLRVIGTVGVLDRANMLGLIDLEAAVARLRNTNFRRSPRLLNDLLAGRVGRVGEGHPKA